MANKLKENWNKKDEVCLHCNNVTKKATGINKQNLKRLCWTKPTMQDVLIFLMLVVILILGFGYLTEVKQYKGMINNPEEFCIEYYNNIISKGLVSPINNNSVDTSNWNVSIQEQNE